jgi:starvation-inducible DNA-binding protein
MSKGHEHPSVIERARPLTVQHAKELQHFGTMARLPIALDEAVCASSTESLNQVLADTMTLRDMYKKHHWQAAGPTSVGGLGFGLKRDMWWMYERLE